MIYLDHAATSPIPEALLPKMQALYLKWGNASSLYSVGREAKAELDNARKKIAELIHARPEEVFFTSGGTEADNWAIIGSALGHPNKKHIITTQIEHHAILNTCKMLERFGYRITYLPVDSYGMVHPQQVKDALSADTLLVSVMTANNEIGTIEPIEEIGQALNGSGVLFHTDAVQAMGQVKVDVIAEGVDLLSMSGHKFGAPKGIGALYVKKGSGISPLINGGAQERGFRAGTENVAGAAGMAMALAYAEEQRKSCTEAMRSIRDAFVDKVLTRYPDIQLNGSKDHRLPSNIHLTIPGITDSSLLLQLDFASVAASAGSACTAGIIEESHVLKAIGMDNRGASLRLTLGKETTESEMEEAFTILCKILDKRKGVPE
ncbi:MAG: cysteine desulfurase [Clostridia bacterium]|nr:cysteine desulfurase [Clostridia bacterium]